MGIRKTPVAAREVRETLTWQEIQEARDRVLASDIPHIPQIQSLVAAAAQIQLDEKNATLGRRRIGHLDWQFESWRHYDINGELRFAAGRHASAVSQVRLFIAELDDEGQPGDPAKDPKVVAIGQAMLGGPAQRSERLRQLGIQFYIGGESYIVAESVSDTKSDVWYVVGARQIKKEGRTFKVERPDELGGGFHVLDPQADLLMRAWTPHPDNGRVADSPTRAVLPVLREIERLSMLTFSQIDSRLISAGLLLLPQGIDFPHKEGSAGGIEGLLEMILAVAQAQLSGAGTAAGLVPILAEIPAGTGSDIVHQKFETALQAELKEKLDHAIRRLATGLDTSPEEMLGQGKSNHWSANQIGEDGIKLFVRPVLLRICDALNNGYLYPALKAAGLDPTKYSVWFDLSPLAVRPNRFEDAVQLHAIGVITDDELRKSGNFSDDAALDDQQLAEWRAWELAKLNPQVILADAGYAKILKLPQLAPPPTPAPALPPGQGDQGDGEQPALTDAQQGDQAANPVPETPSGGASPAQRGLTASAGTLLPGAEQAVLRALELAGGRLLAGRGRHNIRGKFNDVPKHLLHTRVHPTDRDHARELLAGAFTHVGSLANHFGFSSGDLEYLLEGYCVELLVRGYAHEPELLTATLSAASGG